MGRTASYKITRISSNPMEEDKTSLRKVQAYTGDPNTLLLRWGLKRAIIGSVYVPKVLLNSSLNESYNPDYFVTYIETKYLGS